MLRHFKSKNGINDELVTALEKEFPIVSCGSCGEDYNELELSYRDWCDDCEEGDE